MPHTEKQQQMIESLDVPLRPLGEEVLDPTTSMERLREIIEIGREYHLSHDVALQDEVKPDYSQMSDQELSAMLESSYVPGGVKDDIAKYVHERDK